jgi:mono/diheme cytochrome c family protein
MATALKIVGLLIAALVVLVGGGFFWVSSTAKSILEETYSAHAIELDIPAPLTAAELAELGDEADPEAAEKLARERAIERGKHLVSARYGCMDCHGENFGGGVMVDDPAMGSLLGPNITLGEGSVTREYAAADWDRIVRHGIRKDGRPALMPSEDFLKMSDRELSDVITYIRSLPPVDNAVPASTLGPVGKILLATGKFRLSVHAVPDHEAAHAGDPPPAGETLEFGAHIAQVCTGCHRADLQGGPIVQGPPDWAPARNLTPHEDGLAGWTFEQFDTAMRTGVRPSGEAMKAPMSIMTPYAANMTETEMKALWLYISSIEARPTGT